MKAALDGLALDAVRQLLYFCDAGDVGRIGVVSTAGTGRRTLLEQRGTQPRAIVLDTQNRSKTTG